MQTEEFKQEMRRRNGIEGTQSELVRAYGLRRARYRGKAKVRLQNYLIGAACNIRRLFRRLQWESASSLPPNRRLRRITSQKAGLNLKSGESNPIQFEKRLMPTRRVSKTARSPRYLNSEARKRPMVKSQARGLRPPQAGVFQRNQVLF
jgi:hypothetical protein